MAINTDEFAENIAIIESLGISPSEVLRDGFIHPNDNGGIVEFIELIRNDHGAVVRSDAFSLATRIRRFDMATKEEIK